jgi:hypothetical protein
MYDIEGKLKRRAMLERLEGLGRADDATSNAAALPVPDQSPGPRHRNDPVTEPLDDGLSPLHDDLSRRFRSSEPDSPAHAQPVAAVAAPYLEAGPYASTGAFLRPGPVDVPAAAPQPSTTNGQLNRQLNGLQQRHAEPIELEVFEEIPLEVPPAEEAAPDETVLVDETPADRAPAELGSSAATIADLLRHGADRLFFAPNRPQA